MTHGILTSDNWAQVISHLAVKLVDLEKTRRIVPPVELTVYSGEDEHVAAHFHWQDGQIGKGDLCPEELKGHWPLTVRLEDRWGNGIEITMRCSETIV